MTNVQTPKYKPSLKSALKRGFLASYDNLGYVLLATVNGALAVVALLAVVAFILKNSGTKSPVALIVGVMPVALVAWLFSAGVFYYTNRVVYNQHPPVTDTWLGIRKLAGPAIVLFLVDAFITMVLIGDGFYFSRIGGHNLLSTAITILFVYLSVMWAMMVQYHLPLLVSQLETESGTGAFVILRKSALLLLDNPGFTVGLLFVIIAFAVVCAIPLFAGWITLFLGVLAFLLTHALRELFVKYDIVEPDVEPGPEETWRVPRD